MKWAVSHIEDVHGQDQGRPASRLFVSYGQNS